MKTNTNTPPPWVPIVQAKMKSRGLKQYHLLPILNVKTRGAVGHYLTGRNKLSVTQMQSLCDYLGLEVAELLKNDKGASLVQELSVDYNHADCKYHKASKNCQKIFDLILELDKKGVIDSNYTNSLLTLLNSR